MSRKKSRERCMFAFHYQRTLKLTHQPAVALGHTHGPLP